MSGDHKHYGESKAGEAGRKCRLKRGLIFISSIPILLYNFHR